jgi:hypothetical protein
MNPIGQPEVVYSMPESDVPVIFTSIWAGRNEEQALKHAKDFLGRALAAREDRLSIVDSVRIVR